MIIAVNTIFTGSSSYAASYRLYERLFTEWVQRYPRLQFVFLVAADFRLAITGSNATVIAVKTPSGNRIRFNWWNRYSLPRIIRATNAERLVAATGFSCSAAGLPEFILAGSFFSREITGTESALERMLLHRRQVSLRRARGVFTFSATLKKWMLERYEWSGREIPLIALPVSPQYRPLHFEERQLVQASFTNGCAYFLTDAAAAQPDELVFLLKAFSAFKKRQRSAIRLVIVGDTGVLEGLPEKLDTYRFKSELELLNGISEADRARLTAAAYAVVLPGGTPGNPLPAMEARACAVPVICIAASEGRLVYGEQALEVPQDDYQELAAQMMTLYKDEQSRQALVQQLLQENNPAGDKATTVDLLSLLKS